MDYISVILSLADTGLKLWQQKDARKYIDQLIELKQEYYNEINKPEGTRDDARLDRIEFRIKLLCDSFTSSAGQQNSKNMP
jgi:hypothetical protein